MKSYLKETHIINWRHPDIHSRAAALAERCTSSVEIAKNCFEWVRDNIYHSWDFKRNPVTYVASDVLNRATGKLESNFIEIWPDPLDIVISVLKKSHTYQDVYDNLSEIEIINPNDKP